MDRRYGWIHLSIRNGYDDMNCVDFNCKCSTVNYLKSATHLKPGAKMNKAAYEMINFLPSRTKQQRITIKVKGILFELNTNTMARNWEKVWYK